MILSLYILFAICLIIPVYTYVLFPFVLMLLPSKKHKVHCDYPHLSVIVAVSNNESTIDEKIKNLLALDYPKKQIEYIFSVYKCTDGTANIIRNINDPNVHICEFYSGSRSEAINKACEAASGDVLLFTDIASMLEPDVPEKLVRHFADKRIGCVNGLMKPEGAAGVYWKYENWVKRLESRSGVFSGVSKAVYSIRRTLYSPLPDDTINCDFCVVTAITASGKAVIFDEEAVACEKQRESSAEQFSRHVLEGAGNFQAMGMFKKLLLPSKAGFVYVSHRIFKWITPFCLIFLFISNMLLVTHGFLFAIILTLQLAAYLLALVYYMWFIRKERALRGAVGKLFGILFYFVEINGSLLVGVFYYLTRKLSGRSLQ